MKQSNKTLGRFGEEMAEKYLVGLGYKLVEKNYSTKFGEIDLIIAKDNVLRFVEVKLKKGDFFGTPEEMIGTNKLGRVQRMAEYYLMKNKDMTKLFETYSMDAVCIVINQDEDIEKINYYENISF